MPRARERRNGGLTVAVEVAVAGPVPVAELERLVDPRGRPAALAPPRPAALAPPRPAALAPPRPAASSGDGGFDRGLRAGALSGGSGFNRWRLGLAASRDRARVSSGRELDRGGNGERRELLAGEALFD
jgi:hypothetical protein